MIGIIACTKECNLRCKYCFEENNFKTDECASFGQINDAFRHALPLFERFGSELIEYNQKRGFQTEFTFHGGEPLLVNPEYIEHLCAYFSSLEPNTLYNIQTNGTICSDKIVNLFKQYNFRVGVSLDGPAALNDENRVFPNGSGSHRYIMANIQKLQDAGIHVGVMATITSSVTKNVRLFYEFFAANGLDINFNACYNSPNSSHQQNQIDDALYCCFLKDLFDIWIQDERHYINIRPFERILRTMVTKTKDMRVCQFIRDCREVNVSIDCNGDIYRCLHYINLENNSLGNISKTDLESVMAPFLSQPSHWEQVKEGKCGACDVQRFCYGGCPYWSDAKEITGLEGDFSCASQKFIVHYIYNYLKRHMEQSQN